MSSLKFSGDETCAFEYLERACQLNPNDTNIWLVLAHTLDLFRKSDRALPEVLQAIRLSSRAPRLELMYFYEVHRLFHLRDIDISIAADSAQIRYARNIV